MIAILWKCHDFLENLIMWRERRELQQLGQNRHFLSCRRAPAFFCRLMRHDAQFVRINVKAQDCQQHLQS